jgi:hypothetical protein
VRKLVDSFIAILKFASSARYQYTGRKRKRKVGRIVKTLRLKDLVTRKYDIGELDFQLALQCFEITHKVDLPEELASNMDLTIAEFIAEASRLPRVKDPLYESRILLGSVYGLSSGVVGQMQETFSQETRQHERN